jgi:hypothetical protein
MTVQVALTNRVRIQIQIVIIITNILILNYVVWEFAEHFKRAFNRPEFRSDMADVLPNVVMSPHLFKKVAAPGICME